MQEEMEVQMIYKKTVCFFEQDPLQRLEVARFTQPQLPFTT